MIFVLFYKKCYISVLFIYLLVRLINFKKRSKLKAVNDTLKAKMKIKNEKFSCLFDNVNVNIERLHNYNM